MLQGVILLGNKSEFALQMVEKIHSLSGKFCFLDASVNCGYCKRTLIEGQDIPLSERRLDFLGQVVCHPLHDFCIDISTSVMIMICLSTQIAERQGTSMY